MGDGILSIPIKPNNYLWPNLDGVTKVFKFLFNLVCYTKIFFVKNLLLWNLDLPYRFFGISKLFKLTAGANIWSFPELLDSCDVDVWHSGIWEQMLGWQMLRLQINLLWINVYLPQVLPLKKSMMVGASQVCIKLGSGRKISLFLTLSSAPWQISKRIKIVEEDEER